jgi:hypothetical protein
LVLSGALPLARYPLTHHHAAAALSILNLAPTPINPRGTMTSRPDIAAKPPAVDLDDPARNSRTEFES